ncbi:MAG: hypothetical protein FWG15_02825 [Propionibacteriaceae bacterium]|nr:hypothetical protein [Propionibacteriaceae bacterium]
MSTEDKSAQTQSTETTKTLEDLPVESEKKFSQEDLNRILADRLRPLKEKAEAYDKAQEEAKSEAQREQEARVKAEARVVELEAVEARRKAGDDAKLPASFAGLITGSTAEEIASSVEQVQAAYLEATKATENGKTKPQPDPSQGQGLGVTQVTDSVAQARTMYSQKFKKS